MSHQQAIQLNNESVSCIKSGNFSVAIATLSCALRMSRQIMLTESAFNVKEQFRIMSVDDCMEIKDYAVEDMQDDKNGFLYSHPIHVMEDRLGSCRRQSSVVISTAVIFNLALAHHMSASTLPDPFTRLQKAESLYLLGYKLQDEASMTASPLFLLATMNNLGLIYQSLNRTEQAEETFRGLLSNLMMMSGSVGGRNILNFDGYFHTVSSKLFFKHNSAGAA